ncbi:MAG: peptidoglycan DD-metalloendopeptidase family protein [Betaproteobacteria bacterium]|nr:peptidoglycan DD-metalloendopeptidase family protein [Betaproteobacteria bacterium]
MNEVLSLPAVFPSVTTFRHWRFCLKTLTAVFLAVTLIGCSTTRQAPVEERTPKIDNRVTIGPRTPTTADTGATITVTGKTHTVRQGETLFSIAQQNNVDYRELADWNNISDPSKLSAGQVLRLTPPEGRVNVVRAESGVTTAPLQTVPPVGGGGSSAANSGATTTPSIATSGVKTEPKAEKQPYSEQALAAMSRANESTTETSTPTTSTTPTTTTPPTSTTPVAGLDWSWPTQGKVTSTFTEKTSSKGIDIVGAIGQPVVASAAGKVVFVGSALRGYGKMVIIKHNDTFLSVYAHNRELLVQQGQQVTRGQKIAEMGNTDTDQVKLHFEIRKNGDPVDPMQYLPPR